MPDIDTVVYPLWASISSLFSELSPLRNQIVSNCKRMEEYCKKKSDESKALKKRKWPL